MLVAAKLRRVPFVDHESGLRALPSDFQVVLYLDMATRDEFLLVSHVV